MSDEKVEFVAPDSGTTDQSGREKMFARRALLQAGFALPLVAVGGMARKSWGQDSIAPHHDHHDHHARGEQVAQGRPAANRHHDHHDHHIG